MMEICELISNLIQICLMTWFISEFCGYKYNGGAKTVGFAVMLIFDFIFISAVDYFTDYDGLLSAISVVGYVIYGHFALKEKLSVHIFISLFAMVIVFTISSLLFLIASNITKNTAGSLLIEFSLVRFIVLCLCRMTEFSVFKIILYIKKKYDLSDKEWIMFIVVLFLTWVEVMLFTKASIISDIIGIYMTGAAFAAAIINILIYYFVIYVNKAVQNRTELSLMKMQYENVKNMEKNMQTLYDSIYGTKHDIEKHFLYIKTMEEQGHGKKIIEYIDNIIDKQLNVSKIIFTESEVFNALMNIRLAICHKKGINPNINVESSAVSKIKPEDITVLFGNIFDNAIEAAEKTDDKLIMLNIQNQGDYISIYMENSFFGVFDKTLKTTKRNYQEHGFGMKNIKRIVEKYDGMIKCFTDNEMFCCDILLKRDI